MQIRYITSVAIIYISRLFTKPYALYYSTCSLLLVSTERSLFAMAFPVFSALRYRRHSNSGSSHATSESSRNGNKAQVISGSRISERKLQDLLNQKFGCNYKLEVSMLLNRSNFEPSYANSAVDFR